jgi:hypothetical protein
MTGKSLQYKRLAVVGVLAVAVAGTVAALPMQQPRPIPITMYKSPTCGCCTDWGDHMKANGFVVTVRDLENLAPIKADVGVPARLQSCHTAVVEGYVVEGHVPADLVKKMLREKPQVVGIAVPGMPIGSPGMEQGPTKQPYDVVLFDAQGRTTVYAKR